MKAYSGEYPSSTRKADYNRPKAILSQVDICFLSRGANTLGKGTSFPTAANTHALVVRDKRRCIIAARCCTANENPPYSDRSTDMYAWHRSPYAIDRWMSMQLPLLPPPC